MFLLLLTCSFSSYSQKETYSIKRNFLFIANNNRDMKLERFLAGKQDKKINKAYRKYDYNSTDSQYHYFRDLDKINNDLSKLDYHIIKSSEYDTSNDYCYYYLIKKDSIITKFVQGKIIFNSNQDKFALILYNKLIYNDAVYHINDNLNDLNFWGDTIIGYIWDGQNEGVKIHIVKFNEKGMLLKNDVFIDTIKSFEFPWWEIGDFVNPVYIRPYIRPSLISNNDNWILNINGIAIENGKNIKEKYSDLNISYVFASALINNKPLYLYRGNNDKYFVLHDNQHQQLSFDEINFLKTSYDKIFMDNEIITFYGKKGLIWYSVRINHK